MKAKFIFIHATGAITHQTTVYTVWFGSSQKDQRDLRFFHSLTFNADYYFSKYNNDVAEFIYKLNQSLFNPRPEQGILLNTQTVTPSDLKKDGAQRRFLSCTFTKRLQLFSWPHRPNVLH